MVNGMLPDFRFVLGAILAISMLAVAGLGLVTSVRLLHEAQMSPREDQRTLAFAGHAEWNQFYDPDGARRFEGLAGKTEGPLAQARLETPAEPSAIAPPVIAPVSPEERTASIPPSRVDSDIAPNPAEDRTPEADPPHADPAQSAEIAAATIAAPAEPAVGPPAPEVPGTNGSGAPPAERVASAPTVSPGPDFSQETRTPAQESAQPRAAGDLSPRLAPPLPLARPKVRFRKKVARVHIRSVRVVSQQPGQNSGFPPTSAPWPGYDDKFTGATTTQKSTGKLTGTLSNRPQ
jgi:hypothetical protein